MRIITVSKNRRPDYIELYQISYTIQLRKIIDAGTHWVLFLDVKEDITANRLIVGWKCECKKLHSLRKKYCRICNTQSMAGSKVLIKEKIKMLNIFQMRCNYAKNIKDKEKQKRQSKRKKKFQKKRDSSFDL